MVLYQLAFAKYEINRFLSNFFQFPWNILDLNYGEFAKKSSIIANWGWWLEIVDVTSFDMLQKVLSIKVEVNWKWYQYERGWKIRWKCFNKIIERFIYFELYKIYVKITKKKSFLWIFLLSFSNNDTIISFVNLFSCWDKCL